MEQNATHYPNRPHAASSKAISSLLAGVVGFVLFPASIAAIVLGHMARSDIRKSAGQLKGAGMALAGLILGYFGIAIIPVVLIVAAILIPNLLRARIAANEQSAVSAIRAINVAEQRYRSAFPKIGYACGLANLGGTEQFAISPEHAHVLDDSLAGGAKNGYRFSVQNCSAAGDVTITYQVVAYPESHNQTGIRAYCSDETGVPRFSEGGSPETCLEAGLPLPTSR